MVYTSVRRMMTSMSHNREAPNSNRNAQGYEQEKDKCERSIGQLIEGVRLSQSGDQAADEIIQDTPAQSIPPVQRAATSPAAAGRN